MLKRSDLNQSQLQFLSNHTILERQNGGEWLQQTFHQGSFARDVYARLAAIEPGPLFGIEHALTFKDSGGREVPAVEFPGAEDAEDGDKWDFIGEWPFTGCRVHLPTIVALLQDEATREAAQDVIAEILAEYPCPQCGVVHVLRDADVPGATCDCGRKEGCQTRWELGDIWSQMTTKEQTAATAARDKIESNN